MNVTYEKKNAMTFIGYHAEIRPERREIRTAVANNEA